MEQDKSLLDERCVSLLLLLDHQELRDRLEGGPPRDAKKSATFVRRKLTDALGNVVGDQIG
jgi:hypothetical protein